MTTKLFVASLPFEFTDEQLQELFAAVGVVSSAKMVMDREHGRTRGFGFVTMATEDAAKAAIEKINGSSVGDRTVWVTEARPEKERPAHPRPERFPGNERPLDRRPFRDSGRFPRGPRGGGRFPHTGAGPSTGGAPIEGTQQPRRPFGRSGRGMDYSGNSTYYGSTGSYGGQRRSGGRGPSFGGGGYGGAEGSGGRPRRPFGGERGGFGAGPSRGRPFGPTGGFNREGGAANRPFNRRPSSGPTERGSFGRPHGRPHHDRPAGRPSGRPHRPQRPD